MAILVVTMAIVVTFWAALLMLVRTSPPDPGASGDVYFPTMFDDLTTRRFPPGPDYEGSSPGGLAGLEAVATTWRPMSFEYPGDLPRVAAYLGDPRSVVARSSRRSPRPTPPPPPEEPRSGGARRREISMPDMASTY